MWRFGAILASAFVLRATAAVVPTWGQCGGQGWTGPPECAEGAKCWTFDPYYSQCLPYPQYWPPFQPNYWFSFGDSYTQTGFSPTGTLPYDQNAIGNPPYPGWTSANGENWLGFAATKYNNSKIYTYNYASGGATIDAALVPPYAPTVLTLKAQVELFLSGAGRRPRETDWGISNSLFSIWIGINDLGNSYYMGGDRDAFSDQLLDAQFALVQQLYDAGARCFLFANVPPTDRSPLILGQGQWAIDTLKGVIDTYNAKLKVRVQALQNAQIGYRTFIWDTNTQFTKILDNPAEYGFGDVTVFGDGPEYFWLNDLHPTTYAHKLFGEELGKKVLADTIW
ncbi:hypothetical protein BJ165DRAFT_1478774 [Panaeolus papilionaceus]|nr:hypothetical protein BJ165DRAFT_1478774 [Panaeolus papilionaceus]